MASRPGALGVRRRRTANARWMVDALTPGASPRSWAGPPPSGLAGAAVFHGVEGWVRRRAQSAGVEVPGIDEAAHAATARHQRALGDLSLAASTLRAAQVPMLVVKGPALVSRLYEAADLRSYVDLDLLVPPQALGSAVAALETAGCTVLDANWPLLARLGVNELRLVGPTGGPIDLHWSLARGPARADPTPTFATLRSRAVAVKTAQGGWSTLGWADTAVHVAVHAARSGGNRLIWCADLRAAMQHPDADLAELGRRTREWRAAREMLLMLHRASHALGMDLPADLAAALGPARWWVATARAVEYAQPVARSGATRSISRLVARSSGPTAAQTLWTLAAKSARGATTVRGPDDAALLDPASPRSALHPVGGAAARRAFFDAVTGQARAAGR